MNEYTVNMVITLLKNYNECLRDKADIYADRMSDSIETPDTCAKWADRYQIVRIERQRVHEILTYLETRKYEEV